MNDTKWKEIQREMYKLEKSPLWRTKSVQNGYVSSWDGEWFYHFSERGFSDIEWLEIMIMNESESLIVLSLLRSIRVPGEKTVHGYKIYGYIPEGKSIEYL